MIDSGGPQDGIGGVARLAAMVDRHGFPVRTNPDIVRPLARAVMGPSMLSQKLLDQLLVAVHAQAAASV